MTTNHESTQALPFTGPDFKMPGYTGYIAGVQETYKKGPIPSQIECKQPDDGSFIYTRTALSPKPTPNRDPCNNPESFKKPQPGVLWPSLQAKAVQDPCVPPGSSVAFGDLRIDVFRTSYHQDFRAPFSEHERLRSPNRNEDLAKTTASLVDIYHSAYNRVGDKRLQKIISTMRERLEAKMGNSNNNAFKFRKLFQMYDHNKTGQVHYEDFRNMCEQFGMQLDDDSLLALFYVYDPQGTGYLVYHDLAKQLMDPDCYALYANDVDLSAARAEEAVVAQHLTTLRIKYAPHIADLLRVLQAFDKGGSGFLPRQDIMSGCASLGIVLNEKESTGLLAHVSTDAQGHVNYQQLCDMLAAAPSPRAGTSPRVAGITSPR
mmetsp:Transcript_37730/g.84079  ORF Transcript_37730/g.84079 Transcript_37730/m.84079 type:complete len:375 (+) Transcript_37730:126-1250(+)